MAGHALGTSWRVRVVDRSGVASDQVRELVEARLAEVVGEMSQWEPHSHLSAFNRAPAGSWIDLPPDLAFVVAHGVDVANRSEGAFDITLGRIAALLGYGADPIDGPVSDAALDRAAAEAGWGRLAFDPTASRLRQPGGLWLDLSGIGKGFAVDAVTDALGREGLADVLVEIGGELAGRGLGPDGQPWWVDVELPPGCCLPPLRVGLHGLAVATSGAYVRGAHTIDPASHRPLPPLVSSVSVIHSSAMLADAWATAMTVLGPERAPFVAEREALCVRMIWQDGAEHGEWLSPALRRMIAE